MTQAQQQTVRDRAVYFVQTKFPAFPAAASPTRREFRAMGYGWELRPGVALNEVTLEILSQEVIIGLMDVSIMKPIK